jgi:hypothetical protein
MHNDTILLYIYRQATKMPSEKKQAFLSALPPSSSASSSSTVFHTPDLLHHVLFNVLAIGRLPRSNIDCPPIHCILPLVCRHWYLFMKQPKLWMQLIETEAPHLRQALQQEEHQESQHNAVGPAAPFRSAEALFRAWLKSCRRYHHIKQFEEEDKRRLMKRLEGCSLVIAFFCRAEDKEPMAQITIPCDDEEQMAQAFYYKDFSYLTIEM